MKLSKDLVAKSAIAITVFSALATTVVAVSSTSGDLDPATAGIVGMTALTLPIIIFCCSMLIVIPLLVMNIWMLVDVLKRTEVELPNKTMWMVLLIIGLFTGLGGIVALVYYFGPKKKLK